MMRRRCQPTRLVPELDLPVTAGATIETACADSDQT
jgi:hypothetical protein